MATVRAKDERSIAARVMVKDRPPLLSDQNRSAPFVTEARARQRRMKVRNAIL